jgi:uncharacterized protein YciI
MVSGLSGGGTVSVNLDQPSFFVVLMTTKYLSLSEAMINAPDDISSHLNRSKEFHQRGDRLMSGAFLDRPDVPVSTMAILRDRDVAEEYVRVDPFVMKNMISDCQVREGPTCLGDGPARYQASLTDQLAEAWATLPRHPLDPEVAQHAATPWLTLVHEQGVVYRQLPVQSIEGSPDPKHRRVSFGDT